MKWNITLLSALCLFILASCHRRPLDEVCESDTKVPIGTVWEKSEINAQNVTAYFFDQESGDLVREHRFENTAQQIQSYVSLPFGEYAVLVHNEIRDQINNVSIRGYNNIRTFEFFSHSDSDTKFPNRSGDSFVAEPDSIGVAIVRNVKIRPNENNNQLIGITPEQINSYLHIKVHVKGLNNARMPALVNLRNIAGSYLPDINNTSEVRSAIQFLMNNRTYDEGSYTDGSISSEVTIHGTMKDRMSASGYTDRAILLDLIFMLVDKEKTIVTRTVDITKLLSFSKVNNGSVHLNVHVDLNDALPEVDPENGSGMGSEIIDWEGERVDIEL